VVNTVSEAILVLLGERNISVPVNTGVPFRFTAIYILLLLNMIKFYSFLHVYIYIYIYIIEHDKTLFFLT
jgi:hypothetical protein